MTTQSRLIERGEPVAVSRTAVVLLPVLLWLLVPLVAMLLYPLIGESEQYRTWLTGALAVCVLVFSVVVHEVSHGLAAYLCGDPTAYNAGRLTLNPINHISVFGSIVVPLLMHFGGASILLGWAKPVPVDPLRLQRYPRDQAALVLAGPLSNLLLSFLSFTLFVAVGALFNHLYPASPVSLELTLPPAVTVGSVPFAGVWFVLFGLLNWAMYINGVLAIFNLFPIPPLDGFWILRGLVPQKVNVFLSKVHMFGFAILILVLLIPPVQIVFFYPVILLNMVYAFISSFGLG